MERGLPYEDFLCNNLGSIIANTINIGKGLGEEEGMEYVHDFIDMFINGAVVAYGRPRDGDLHSQITREFWIYFKAHAKMRDFSFDIRDDHWGVVGPTFGKCFVDVIVKETKEMTALPRKGRAPKSGWKIVAAIACRVIGKESYPETQAKMIEKIDEEINKLGINLDYSHETIKDFVSTIYKFKPR
ncbi:hypothetical protein [Azospirillum formosense]|uniref:hypothetical protein n=1 Tax=Azospirillum formosense TaxID=861533 RepID=UPI00339039A3